MNEQPTGWSSVCIAIDTSISHCKDTAGKNSTFRLLRISAYFAVYCGLAMHFFIPIAKIQRKQRHFKEQVFAFCSFLPIAMHSLFRFLAPLSVSACKDTTSAISASGYGGLRPVSQGQMRINPLSCCIPIPNYPIKCKDTAAGNSTFRFYADFDFFCRHLLTLVAFFPIPLQRYGNRKQHFQFIAVYAYFCSLLQFSSAFFQNHCKDTASGRGVERLCRSLAERCRKM